MYLCCGYSLNRSFSVAIAYVLAYSSTANGTGQDILLALLRVNMRVRLGKQELERILLLCLELSLMLMRLKLVLKLLGRRSRCRAKDQLSTETGEYETRSIAYATDASTCASTGSITRISETGSSARGYLAIDGGGFVLGFVPAFIA